MAANGVGEQRMIDAALRTWQQGADRATKLFVGLSDEQTEREIAPGKNRLLYLFGHLLAVNDAMLAQLRLSERMHPELDAVFLKAADRAVATPPAGELKSAWVEVHERLAVEMPKLTAAEWVERHALVSEEDFAKEPHRNRFMLLLSRTGHMAYHLGQAVLVK